MLAARFFNRPTLEVARELLGKFLVRRYRGGQLELLISEVEAYDGPDDRASHANRGLTPRTQVMFGPAGIFYVYFTYGMHWLLNVVTGPSGYPAAVLLRGGMVPDSGRGRVSVSGPARLTKYMHVGPRLNARRARPATGLWFEDRGVEVTSRQIVAGKRIGVAYAADWEDRPYNLRLAERALVRLARKPQLPTQLVTKTSA
ncbi:MAG: DNA-3-methyladenine glycosylase [Candidatus Binataceae bacterium]